MQRETACPTPWGRLCPWGWHGGPSGPVHAAGTQLVTLLHSHSIYSKPPKLNKNQLLQVRVQILESVDLFLWGPWLSGGQHPCSKIELLGRVEAGGSGHHDHSMGSRGAQQPKMLLLWCLQTMASKLTQKTVLPKHLQMGWHDVRDFLQNNLRGSVMKMKQDWPWVNNCGVGVGKDFLYHSLQFGICFNFCNKQFLKRDPHAKALTLDC